MRGVENIPWLYDALCTVMEWRGLAKWRGWLTGGAQGRTLEVGCGTGRNLLRYTTAETLIACEPDGGALQRARSRQGQALLVRASAEALPFRDGAFDTVVSSLVFCSVPRPEVGLAELKRTLSLTGSLRMLEHVRNEVERWGRVQDTLQPAWTAVAGGCHPNRRTVEAVQAAGFTLDADSLRKRGNMRRFVASHTPQNPSPSEPPK